MEADCPVAFHPPVPYLQKGGAVEQVYRAKGAEMPLEMAQDVDHCTCQNFLKESVMCGGRWGDGLGSLRLVQGERWPIICL